MTKKNKAIVVVLLLLCVVLIVSPVLALRGAEFGGSDDAGSVKVAEITGEEYEPWFTPCSSNCSAAKCRASWRACCSVCRPASVWRDRIFPRPVRRAEKAGGHPRKRTEAINVWRQGGTDGAALPFPTFAQGWWKYTDGAAEVSHA